MRLSTIPVIDQLIAERRVRTGLPGDEYEELMVENHGLRQRVEDMAEEFDAYVFERGEA